MHKKKFAVLESRLKLSTDWRRVQVSFMLAQKWHKSVTSVALFDLCTFVGLCQTRTVHSRSFQEESKPWIVETASLC